ncbi:hypothetical protein RF11_05196 [Thelohanellus kitauei]|uniref:Uncharacterized protein n=1 Tax=Thelohanellus kitauei TaxID=669202 RepID=A0A0C2MLT5_THEKT|nr:hypothetical protein RF11_05196 [Thelohanellus kitauei]
MIMKIGMYPDVLENAFKGKRFHFLRKNALRYVWITEIWSCPLLNHAHAQLKIFPGIIDLNHSQPGYIYRGKNCVLDPFFNITEPVKTCRDGGIPLNHLNGYDPIFNRFAPLDPYLCSPRQNGLEKSSNYCDYCISTRISNFKSDYSINLFIFLKSTFKNCQLDYKGHYLPAPDFKKYSLPTRAGEDTPICYNIKSNAIYLYLKHTIFLFKEKNGAYKSQKTSLYRLKFDIVSIEYDNQNSLLFILDVKNCLFVISTKDNFIKLLSHNVTSFRYHPNTL